MYVQFCLENDYTDLHQTWHAYSLTPGREHRKVKTPESVLSLIPGDGVSCSSETARLKNGAKTKVVCSEEEIRETKSTTPKISWVGFPVKIFSIPWKVMAVEKHR
jgi:hypothetical protein